MSDLSQLSPQAVWAHFAKVCSIPHPSYHEDQLACYIMQWAQQRNLHAQRDTTGNVLVRKPASKGFEQRKGVVLQAHLDMVSQKNNATEHDFTKDPIQPYVAGEWVTARGTTLGADNGLGVASVLAVLGDDSVEHGPLEALFTITEETGMDGALGLQPDWLQGEILINTDFEQEGQICVGCAGGVDVVTTLDIEREALTADYQQFQLVIGGLKGGHSGCDIHLGRGNAIKLLARVLAVFRGDVNYRLLDLQGGNARNAIPREAVATLAVEATQVADLQQQVADFQSLLQNELAVETSLHITLQPVQTASVANALSQASRDKLINLLNVMPNGVMRNSDVVSGVVETSLSIGVLRTQPQQVEIVCLIRSLIDSGKEYVVETLQALGQLAGAKLRTEGTYPGWQPDSHSPLLQQAGDIYQRIFNQQASVTVIHAGLECGLFKRPYPDMEMISIGPTITGAHSPDEQVHIASVDKYWRFLCQLLKNIG